MKRKAAIIAVRGIGALAGLLGAYMLNSAFRMPFILGDDLPWLGRAVFAIVPAVIAIACLWVAYLVWFRFSPHAVQQACGLLGFLLLLFFLGIRPEVAVAALWYWLAFIVLAVFVLWSYRGLSRYLNDVIFRPRLITMYPE